MSKYTILSSLVIGVVAFFVTAGINRMFGSTTSRTSSWVRRSLIVFLVFIAALGVKALIG